MCRAGDEVQLLVARAGGGGEDVLGHVQRVGALAGYHQQRGVDQLRALHGVEAHEVDVAADRVGKAAARVSVGLAVVIVAVAVEVVGQLVGLRLGHLAHICGVAHFLAAQLQLARLAGLAQALLYGRRRRRSRGASLRAPGGGRGSPTLP